MVRDLLVHAGKVVGTGLTGVVVYDGVKRIVRSSMARGAAVTATTWGLRGARAAETGAERVRLSVGDIVSEARERMGEQAPAPGAGSGEGHEH